MSSGWAAFPGEGDRSLPELFLLRHADALPGDADDHERRLSRRGLAEAVSVGQQLIRTGSVLSSVLCSSALRTRETLAALRDADALPTGSSSAGPRVQVEAGLYLASSRQMLERLQQLPSTTSSALLIGHNPGIYDLATQLIGEGDRDAYGRLRAGMAPAALCRLEFSGNWPHLCAGAGRLISFDLPT